MMTPAFEVPPFSALIGVSVVPPPPKGPGGKESGAHDDEGEKGSDAHGPRVRHPVRASKGASVFWSDAPVRHDPVSSQRSATGLADVLRHTPALLDRPGRRDVLVCAHDQHPLEAEG